MAAPLDLQKEYTTKKGLRDSLQLQVTMKGRATALQRAADVSREQNILRSLTMDLRRERDEKWSGKMAGDGEMGQEWDKQIAIAKRLRALGI